MALNVLHWGELSSPPGAFQLGTLLNENTLIWICAEVRPRAKGGYEWGAYPDWRTFEHYLQNDLVIWKYAETLEDAKAQAIGMLKAADYLEDNEEDESL